MLRTQSSAAVQRCAVSRAGDDGCMGMRQEKTQKKKQHKLVGGLEPFCIFQYIGNNNRN